MNRIKNIQRLFNLSCVNRRSGNPDLALIPLYYSINENGSIDQNTDIIQATVRNPKYVICYVGVPKLDFYGKLYHSYDLVAITDRNGELIKTIALNNWSVMSLGFYNDSIQKFKLSFNNNNSLTYEFLSPQYKILNADFWELITGIDNNCTTPREAALFLDYFVAKKNAAEVNLSIEDYKTQIAEQNNVIKQYKELLSNFQEIVDGSHKISKT